jgi:thiamine pyrophosphate-dependent acetolactate synthase large subunit-like protein
MADGYARASGKIAVASVHQGPGFTNTLTGLTEAAKCRTPLLVLAADVPPSTLWSNFKIEQGILAETVGAVTERVRGPETAAADTARALRRARIERRPVVLNIPINLVDASCDGGSSVVPDWPALEPPRPSDRSVVEVADLLEGASHWPTGWGRYWRRARWRMGSSLITRTASGSPAASPRRSP